MNYFLEKIFKLQRFTKVLIQVSCDATVISLCFLMSMAMRLDSLNFVVYYDVWKILLIIVPFTLFIYFLLGFYKAISIYFGENCSNCWSKYYLIFFFIIHNWNSTRTTNTKICPFYIFHNFIYLNNWYQNMY